MNLSKTKERGNTANNHSAALNDYRPDKGGCSHSGCRRSNSSFRRTEDGPENDARRIQPLVPVSRAEEFLKLRCRSKYIPRQHKYTTY